MKAINRRIAFAALLAAATVASGCLAAASPPQSAAEYATERTSAQGAFRVSYQSNPAKVPVGSLHAWTLHVATADGQPVTDAVIGVDGDMPQHLHGLPTKPRVTRNLGNGDYLVEGIKFQMGGWWVMDFDVASGARKDKVRFHLQLKR